MIIGKLEDLLSVSKEKNKKGLYEKTDVLSVSSKGVYNQIEYLGRSFAGKSISNYGILKKNDIVYTKSPLKANPYGIIKSNDYQAGVVSTLYAIYNVHENASAKYIDYMFTLTTTMNNYARPLVRKGAKNDMKVSNEDFLKGKIEYHPVYAQKKIVDILSQIDNLICTHEVQLSHIQCLKQKLLVLIFNEYLLSKSTEYFLYDLLKKTSQKNTKKTVSRIVSVGKNGIADRTLNITQNSDFSKNKILEPKQAVIGMGSKQIDFGINFLGEDVILSPAYHTFRVNNTVIDSKFLNYYFKVLNSRYSHLYMITGARQGKSVAVDDLLREKIKIPKQYEQLRVLNLLSQMDNYTYKGLYNVETLFLYTKVRIYLVILHIIC